MSVTRYNLSVLVRVSKLNQVPGFRSLRTLPVAAAILLFAHAPALHAQRIDPPKRLDETIAKTTIGQLNVRVQQDSGAPFLDSVTVSLRSSDMSVDLLNTTGESAQTTFKNLPSGQYFLEISCPGFGTVREQVSVNISTQVQEVSVTMLPETTIAAARSAAAANIPRNAIKETEKGLRALQINKLTETQSHLTRALAYAPNFADGNYLMGVLFLRKNDPVQALTYLQKAVDVAPNHAPAQLALGQASYLRGDFPRATKALEQCLNDQPSSVQAVTAKELIARMRESASSTVARGGPEGAGGPSGAAGIPVASRLTSDKVSVHTLLDVASITPEIETNWLPADVDRQKVDLDPGVTCQLDDVIHGSGERVKELVKNVERFTAVEDIEHYKLSPLGLQISKENRKFDYMVEIRPFGTNDLDVQEFRNGSVSGQQFPGHIATNGLPTLALVFHPFYQNRYDFVCEGRGKWRDTPAWLVHFQQPTNRKGSLLIYRVGPQSYAVGLKGRAWIDTQTFQILAIETDTMRPVPEIRLVRDHQLIEYGPVAFKNSAVNLWLPKSADWYSSLSGQRYHRRHTFSQFLLFSIDDTQTISKPKDAPPDPSPPDHP